VTNIKKLDHQEVIRILKDMHTQSLRLMESEDSLLVGPFEQLHGRIESLLQSLAISPEIIQLLDEEK